MKTKEEIKEYNKSYGRTKEGMISLIYCHQRHSSKQRNHKMPTYTKLELKEWLYSQPLFRVLFDNWKRLDFQSIYKPSVDRKNEFIGYTMDNIRLMTWGENQRNPRQTIRGKNNKNSKSKKHYSNKTTKRRNFENICRVQGWNFDDFEEIETKERICGHKKYYYILKDVITNE